MGVAAPRQGNKTGAKRGLTTAGGRRRPGQCRNPFVFTIYEEVAPAKRTQSLSSDPIASWLSGREPAKR